MKKLILILSIILLPLQANAFEDYIIVSENPVKSVYCEDDEIADIVPFFTIDNIKSTLLLKSKKEGSTLLVIETTQGEAFLNIEVKDNETIIPQLEGLHYFILDIPPLKEQKREKPVLRGI